jgi:hypothetical protein
MWATVAFWWVGANIIVAVPAGSPGQPAFGMGPRPTMLALFQNDSSGGPDQGQRANPPPQDPNKPPAQQTSPNANQSKTQQPLKVVPNAVIAPRVLMPPPAETGEPKEAEAKPGTGGSSIPYRTRTGALEVIGSTDAPAEPAPFSPVKVTTAPLEVIGSDKAPAPPAPFTPVRVRTEPLEVIGTPSGG